jgi:YhcH/YjgK/YiaL family protein
MALFGSLSTIRAQAPRSPALDAALSYASEILTPGSTAHARLLGMPAGETVRIDLGGGVHAMEQVYRTRAREEGRWESHRAHADLQLVVAGEELLEVAEAVGMSVVEDRTPGADVIFYAEGPAAGELRLVPGTVALLFPADAHLGGLAAGAVALVRKTVVKIPVGE